MLGRPRRARGASLEKEESKEFIKDWLPGSGAEDYVVSANVTAYKPGRSSSELALTDEDLTKFVRQFIETSYRVESRWRTPSRFPPASTRERRPRWARPWRRSSRRWAAWCGPSARTTVSTRDAPGEVPTRLRRRRLLVGGPSDGGEARAADNPLPAPGTSRWMWLRAAERSDQSVVRSEPVSSRTEDLPGRRSFEIEMDRFRRIALRRDASNGTLVTANAQKTARARGGGDREMRFREPARDDLTFARDRVTSIHLQTSKVSANERAWREFCSVDDVDGRAGFPRRDVVGDEVHQAADASPTSSTRRAA